MSDPKIWPAPHSPENEIFIGRDPVDVTIILDHPLVSRRHAKLRNEQGRIFLSDCGSANGTFVNDRRVVFPTPLNFGDRITVGPFELAFDGQGVRLKTGTERPMAVSARSISRISLNNAYLVQPLSLEIPLGEFVVVIGPSGSGKSTLISLLSGRIPASSGKVLVVGREVSSGSQRNPVVAYVPQHDSFLEDLTVRQSLTCTARLRLPPDMSSQEIKSSTDHVLQLVGLTQRDSTRIGRLSGGERRRLSLAQELLADPAILVLDEVTSGLDEQSDQEIMDLLARVVAAEKTILCVTHNLAHIQATCGRVIVMGHYGKLDFVGTPSQTCTHYGTQRIESVIAAMGPAVGTRVIADRNSSHQESNTNANSAEVANDSARIAEREVRSQGGGWRRLSVLLYRQMLQILANPESQILSLLVTAMVCWLLVIRFDNLADPGLQGDPIQFAQVKMQSSSLMLFLTVASFFLGCFAASRTLVMERRFFWREAGAGLPLGMYLASKVILPGAFAAIQTYLLGLAVATNRHLALDAHWMGAICALTSLTGLAVGLLMSAVARREEQVNSVLTLVTIPQMVLSQALIPLDGWLRTFSEWFIITLWSHRAAQEALPVHLQMTSIPDSRDWTKFIGMSFIHIAVCLATTHVFLWKTARGEDPARP